MFLPLPSLKKWKLSLLVLSHLLTSGRISLEVQIRRLALVTCVIPQLLRLTRSSGYTIGEDSVFSNSDIL
jgi:hypothetical protein